MKTILRIIAIVCIAAFIPAESFAQETGYPKSEWTKAKAILEVENTPTSVKAVNATSNNEQEAYSLNGVRMDDANVTNPQIIIKNNKKYLVK